MLELPFGRFYFIFMYRIVFVRGFVVLLFSLSSIMQSLKLVCLKDLDRVQLGHEILDTTGFRLS